MWRLNTRGNYEFLGGKEDWDAAARIAERCSYYADDDEDEMTAEEPVSCYNCLYRRWTTNSFICQKVKQTDGRLSKKC